VRGGLAAPGERQLPSTTALRVFAAVAKDGAASRAARRLNLTQSAVSKQLLGLEAQVGATLFERGSSGLRLTEAGRVLLPYAEAALEQMARGLMRVAERAGAIQPIRLHMVPIVGERWLIDRFPAFAAAHPDIDVQFTSYVDETSAETPDLAIRNGTGGWRDGASSYLFGRRVMLVASPELIARSGGLAAPADIQRLTYLQHFQMPAYWAEMTEALELRGALPLRTVRYGYFSVIIKAAVAGLGAALVPACLVREELEAGQLVDPLGVAFDSAAAFWLTVTGARPAPPGLDLFVGWLTSGAAAFDAAPG
jgi:LysR family transcriptional regulator, glycine cleavage system transcriptional activator